MFYKFDKFLQFPEMPRTVVMREEELERLEEEGGLKKATITDRENYYSHFEKFFLEETQGETVPQALATDEGRAQFEKLLGRSALITGNA